MIELENPLAAKTSSFDDSSLPLQLQTSGCCRMCSLRFLGQTFSLPYINAREYLKNERFNDVENGHKIAKTNPCIACLGILQYPEIDNTIDKVAEAIKKEDYDSNTFNVALTLPIAFYLRAHSLWLFLTSNFPSHCTESFPNGCVVIGVKEAWKIIVVPEIEKRIKKKYDVNAELVITISVSYGDDYTESLSLVEMHPDVYGKMATANKKNKKKIVFSRKSVDNLLKQTSVSVFKKYYPVPPSVPTLSAVCDEVNLTHNSVFLAGRYNKYSRNLPQTPWILNGVRRMNSSVQETIAGPLQTLAKAHGNKFIAAGREDVDVRMLGLGRPFVLELINPHKSNFTIEEMRTAEKIISSVDNGIVRVIDLQHVSKNTLEIMKEGEQTKTKEYVAYCVAWGVTASRIQTLSTVAPLTVYQKTPVRVLHRRPIATRPKVIHTMKVSVVKECPDKIYFNMTLKTQAGTYIKEFIHGDFGRTTPNIGELLGDNVSADVLALDVGGISLDWPPAINYNT